MKDKKWSGVTCLLALVIMAAMYGGISLAGRAVLTPKEEPERWEGENRPFFLYQETDEKIQVMPWKEYDEEKAVPLNDEEMIFLQEHNIPALLTGLVTWDLEERGFSGSSLEGKILSGFRSMELESGIRLFFFETSCMGLPADGGEALSFSIRCVLDEGGRLIEYECLKASGKKEGLYEENKLRFMEYMKKNSAVFTVLGWTAEEYFFQGSYKKSSALWELLPVLRTKFALWEADDQTDASVSDSLSWAEVRDSEEGQVLELEDHLLLLIQGKYPVYFYYDLEQGCLSGFNFYNKLEN